ncbi:BnaC03g34530D [Brassica napus]|uniref:BnaC03g34530D protein n=1 Tax=Brassica napus TaxID=3708 RepID=A0A078IJ59_BRANA|nr:BnaC03g34530D [Brassica napus]
MIFMALLFFLLTPIHLVLKKNRRAGLRSCLIFGVDVSLSSLMLVPMLHLFWIGGVPFRVGFA